MPKISKTDRTAYSSSYSKASQISSKVLPFENRHHFGTSTFKNNSIQTISSPQYIFSPVLYCSQQNNLQKTNHTTNLTDQSFGIA